MILTGSRRAIRALCGALSIAALVSLSACSTVRRIDSDVQALSVAPADYVWQGARYRFERLPSQSARLESEQAEAWAARALASVGLIRDDSAAQISVLVGLESVQYFSDPWGRPHMVGPLTGVNTARGIAWVSSPGARLPPTPQYQRRVSLLIRDLRSGTIVYETRALHDGPWHDDAVIFPVMFEAALAGFPMPQPGVRRVEIEVGR
ncbi:MAG: hypothetical protein RI906_3451 [Pseudomonadota bacterium]|jgi:hypothetical protein